jgi:hypothetical protein
MRDERQRADDPSYERDIQWDFGALRIYLAILSVQLQQIQIAPSNFSSSTYRIQLLLRQTTQNVPIYTSLYREVSFSYARA